MISNLERYKKDLDSLLTNGELLSMSLQNECYGEEFEKAVKDKIGGKAKEYLDSLPKFSKAYQPWYSEAKSLIKQLLPDRLADFVRHYEKPKPRRDINFE